MTQRWDPQRYSTDAGFVAKLGAPLLDLLDPQPGQRVLDIGCGEGTLTAQLAERGAIVVGIDSSAEQVAAARDRGLDARVADAACLTFDNEFDAIISNAALHWIPRAADALDSTWRALRRGGRLVAEFGGAGNVGAVVAAIHAALARRGIDPEPLFPWYFPSPEEYRELLERRGFVVDSLTHFPRPTPLPGPLSDWLRIFAGPYLAALPDAERALFLDEVSDRCRDQLQDASGAWTVDYVRLRVVARKPL